MTILLDSQALRSRRLAAGWTERGLARHLGTTALTIRRLEAGTGHSQLTLGRLTRLAAALGTTPAELLSDTPTAEPDPAVAAAGRKLLAARAPAAAATLQTGGEPTELFLDRLDHTLRHVGFALHHHRDQLAAIPADITDPPRRQAGHSRPLTLAEARQLSAAVHGRLRLTGRGPTAAITRHLLAGGLLAFERSDPAQRTFLAPTEAVLAALGLFPGGACDTHGEPDGRGHAHTPEVPHSPQPQSRRQTRPERQ